MLTLQVRLDADAYDQLERAAQGAAGDEAAMRRAVLELVGRIPVFSSQARIITDELDAWFDIPSMSSPDFWRQQREIRTHIERNLDDSIQALERFLPDVEGAGPIPMAIHLVPGFAKCYGASPGHQIFGLRTNADPQEALLFLIHVYYHETSPLFYSETSRQADAGQKTVALLKHWLLLLIQNEGVANHIVLPQLLELRNRGCNFTYFTYAPMIGNQEAAAAAMAACREIVTRLDERTLETVRRRLSQVLKNPALPVANLVGIHLAEAIASARGEAALTVAGREPQQFFQLYRETNDPLRAHLFGPGDEAAPALGLAPTTDRASVPAGSSARPAS
jgi:hypothetical protein